ncbi:MAG: oligosaccharide flippase family protein [Bacilli bacterium]|nr:oligosaccharide flippase family protein [Bacilli bacterium]
MKNLKIATILSYITLIVGNLISLVSTPFILSTLGDSEYGLFSLINSMIAYIYILDLGFSNAIIRYNSKYIAEKKEDMLKKINGMFMKLYLLISVLAISIGGIMYHNFNSIFSHGLNSNEISRIKVMFIIALVNVVISFPLNVFNGIIISKEEFVFSKLIALVRSILNPIMMMLVLCLGARAIGMLIASTILNFSLGLWTIIFCFKKLRIELDLSYFNLSIFKEIFKFSFFVFLASIAYQIYWSTDQFVLGMYANASAIAIYTVGSQFTNYYNSFSTVVSSMFLPQLTKIISTEKDPNNSLEVLIKVSRFQYYIASLILMGFLLIGKQFIFLWVGKEYEVSYYIAILTMLPQLLSCTQAIFNPLLDALNKNKVKSYIYLSVSIINLAITLFLVNILGPIGCALGTCIGMIINFILNNVYYGVYLKLNMVYYWKNMILLIFPTMISYIIGKLLTLILNPISYMQISIFIIIFVFIFGVVFWLSGFNKEEKNGIIDSVYRRDMFSKKKNL